MVSREAKLTRSAGMRFASLRCVLEGVEDGGDRAAFMRTAEALGVLHVHEVVADHTVRAHQANGGEKWLIVHKHMSVNECVSALHAEGFTLQVAVDLHVEDDVMAHTDLVGEEDLANQVSSGKATSEALACVSTVATLQEIDFESPTALVFAPGGASRAMFESAAGAFRIPLCGIGRTLDQSVAVALVLHWARHARTSALGAQGLLNGMGGDLLPTEVIGAACSPMPTPFSSLPFAARPPYPIPGRGVAATLSEPWARLQAGSPPEHGGGAAYRPDGR